MDSPNQKNDSSNELTCIFTSQIIEKSKTTNKTVKLTLRNYQSNDKFEKTKEKNKGKIKLFSSRTKNLPYKNQIDDFFNKVLCGFNLIFSFLLEILSLLIVAILNILGFFIKNFAILIAFLYAILRKVWIVVYLQVKDYFFI